MALWRSGGRVEMELGCHNSGSSPAGGADARNSGEVETAIDFGLKKNSFYKSNCLRYPVETYGILK
ncbi:unnamed protein product [Protopolystoma xenopodis]|uniref:Uncharacterized protein n=1 Tax=Protopolystoma xenopodis TaxID=117903 RepID=A0A3S5ASR8_9PLAT|nr:unnamed protein product [Protopolystoma xenopodis]